MTRELLDKKGRPVVVVTGFGLVTPLGRGKHDNWRALASGTSGIRKITRFSTEGLTTKIAGTVDFVTTEPLPGQALALAFAIESASEAIAQADIGTKGSFPGPLFLATPPATLEWAQRKALYSFEPPDEEIGYSHMLKAARSGKFNDMYHLFQYGSVGDHLADQLGTQGQPISLSTACASGASAIQLGVEAIRRKDTGAALCIGTDGSVNVEAMVRFSLLSALSTKNDIPEKASKPFSKNRDGFVMSEGSAAFVFESYEHARARGAKILGVVRGCGERADNFHRTRSKPDGSANIGAIQNTLDDAGVTIDEIDYINAHGTSTPENDKMEYLSLKAVFGNQLVNIPISSNKSMIGHTLTAAGAIEAAFSLLTIHNNIVPPTINCDIPDPDIELDLVPNEARAADVNMVLSDSFGFGGQNVCLVLAAEPA
jgi:3-oxoacyl-[acyl-carrier-protein] synthase II